ncbi:Hpt domain-containing protein [Psychrobacter sp. APC 3279]|uniref:Hpt domain-containing protein n=1 Tax=unclassified Psychrobacter TaxID=196806 RepID=UPI0019180A8E|nr:MULTISPECIES: Hpt domain-containing protein [unclassified Psychrobacter]MDN3440688.1 Hpt domain-containing protein [Psychrobacter sp. APC 3279]|tara:strand:- start:813 stop:1193 length:381 start_codon:yes stop_codon:yes gene_type:complete
MTDMTNNNMTGQTDEEIINHEQFEDMHDLLEEDFVELIQVYLNDSQKRVATLRIAQQEDDNANGFETAHALKGASANLGTTQLVRLSSQLQECCRERRISEQADLIEEIAAALQRAEQEINQRLGQ